MSNEALVFNNRCLHAVATEAFGNALHGNDERGLRYLRGLLQLIELQGKVLECDADGQAHKAFHDLMHSLAAEQEGWPAYDRSKAKESAAKWAAKGLKLPSDDNFQR